METLFSPLGDLGLDLRNMSCCENTIINSTRVIDNCRIDCNIVSNIDTKGRRWEELVEVSR